MAEEYHPSDLTIVALKNGTYGGTQQAGENNRQHIQGCEKCKPKYDTAPAEAPHSERGRFGRRK